jgi:hypothetical protein
VAALVAVEVGEAVRVAVVVGLVVAAAVAVGEAVRVAFGDVPVVAVAVGIAVAEMTSTVKACIDASEASLTAGTRTKYSMN